MANETEVPPALSAEQWAGNKYDVPTDKKQCIVEIDRSTSTGAPFLFVDTSPLSAGSPSESEVVFVEPSQAHVVIAMANELLPDDSPHKITREDIKALEYLITDGMTRWKAPLPELFALRDKLVALLRPE